MPFSAMHAHLGGTDAATSVHGGHDHVLSHEHDAAGNHIPAEVVQIVDLEPALTSQTGSHSMFWALWLPLACAIVVLACAAPVMLSLLRPPRSARLPPSTSLHWRPPLRGPPLLSIQAV